MSLRAAHRFLGAVRSDPALADRVAALGPDPQIEDLVALGAAIGLEFDAEALRAAHRQDWALRSLAESGKGSGAGKRASSSDASSM